MPCDRRTYLGLLAGAAATGAAGCLGGGSSDGAGTPADSPTASAAPTDAQPPRSTDAPTAGTSATPATDGRNGTDATGPGPTSSTPIGGRFVLRSVDPGPATPLRIYPSDLRETLRAAATGDGPVRTAGSATVYVPEPVLPTLRAVELVDPGGDAGGVYAVDCQGGTRYELLVGVEEAAPPGDATVTPVEHLPEEHRAFVTGVIEDHDRYVSPETPRGEWVRTEFFGAFFSHEGTIYRGIEVQQTDAAFFSTEVWYVLSLSPAPDATDPVTLDLSPVPRPVRAFVDPLLAERSKDQSEFATTVSELPDAVRSFVASTDRILTHTAALAVDIEG